MNLIPSSSFRHYIQIISVYFPALPLSIATVFMVIRTATKSDYFISSFFMISPALLQLISVIGGSFYFDRLSDQNKALVHAILRFTGITITIVLCVLPMVYSIQIALFVIICVSLSADQFLASSAILTMREQYVTYREFTAIGVLIGRCSFALAPLIAITLINNPFEPSEYYILIIIFPMLVLGMVYPAKLNKFKRTEKGCKNRCGD